MDPGLLLDRQERIGGVASFFEHPLVEFQPAEFAVDEKFGFRTVGHTKFASDDGR